MLSTAARIHPCPLPLHLTRDEPLLGPRLRRDKTFVRVRAGVYTGKLAWLTLKPWERYLVRVHAVAITRPGSVFVLESAAALRGLPVFGEPRSIHVVETADSTSRCDGDVVVHTRRGHLDVDEASGVHLTSLVDSTLDLCRVLPPAFAVATADAALRGLLRSGNLVDLREPASLLAGRRGARQLNWALDRATPVAESVGESVSRTVIAWLGFEDPELQTVFGYEGHEDRSDFYWRRQRIIGESDGYGKYDAGDIDTAKATLVNEKIREDRLRRYESGMIRWDWKDTVRFVPLDNKLQRGGLRPSRPRAEALLRTLANNPRSLPHRPAVGPA